MRRTHQRMDQTDDHSKTGSKTGKREFTCCDINRNDNDKILFLTLKLFNFCFKRIIMVLGFVIYKFIVLTSKLR